jgi:hypothetical protein
MLPGSEPSDPGRLEQSFVRPAALAEWTSSRYAVAAALRNAGGVLRL